MNRRVEIDDELIELFADDPELLAIVDAVAATQQPPATSGRRRPLVLVAAATIVIAIAVGLATQQATHAGVIERALRAVDVHRVLHLTVVDERADGQLINLRTGVQQPLRHVIDEWYDPAHGIRGLRDSAFGVLVTESRLSARGEPVTGDIRSFVQAYRRALMQRDVSSIRSGHIGRRSVYWLALRKSGGMTVAVARDTAHPVLIRYGHGARARDFRVVGWSGAKTVPTPHRPGTLSGRLRRLSPISQPSRSERSVVASLGSVRRLPALRRSDRFVVVGREAPAFELTFAAKPVRGRLDGPYFRIAVAPQPLTGLGWTPAEAAIPESSALLLTGKPTYAFARLGGAYVAIETTLSQRATLASLRALQVQ